MPSPDFSAAVGRTVAAMAIALLVAMPALADDTAGEKQAGLRVGAREKVVVGEVERVRLDPIGVVLEARIDTGATSSSIHATDIVEFTRGGAPWVRFVVRDPQVDTTIPLELPVARVAAIRRRGGGAPARRPAVAMELTLGQMTRRVHVNLVDRTGLDYPLLVGRDFLRGLAVVDVSTRHVQGPPAAPAPR